MPVTEVTDTEPVKDTKKYVDFGERKIKGKQVETVLEDKSKVGLDELTKQAIEDHMNMTLFGAMFPRYSEYMWYEKGDLIIHGQNLLEAKEDLQSQVNDHVAEPLPKEYSPDYVSLDDPSNKWQVAKLRNVNNSDISKDYYNSMPIASVYGGNFTRNPIIALSDAFNTQLRTKESIYLSKINRYPDLVELYSRGATTSMDIPVVKDPEEHKLQQYIISCFYQLANQNQIPMNQLPEYPWNLAFSHRRGDEAKKIAPLNTAFITMANELNAAAGNMAPPSDSTYLKIDYPVGPNMGLLDAQLKKVSDQLDAIPATLNPSIDGTIVKKDSTVAENLMLLDTQINNLKQEVEQLKNK